MLESYNQSINFYFDEMPTYQKILGVEQKITTEVTRIDGKKLPIPIKAVMDLITKNKLDEIEIIDHKFVYNYSDGDTDVFGKWIQAMFCYHAVKEKYGEAPTRIIFNECKTSKNRDNSPQLQPYTFEFSGARFFADLATFYELFEKATQQINLKGFQFLPNPKDMFDGQITFEIFRTGVIGTDAPMPVSHKTKEVQYVEKNFVPSALDKVENKDLPIQEKIRVKAAEFGILLTPDKVYNGAAVDLYTYVPARGISMVKISKLVPDLAQGSEADHVRIIAPIRGTNLVGVEIPAKIRKRIDLAEQHLIPNTLNIPVGVDVYGKTIHKDITDMPHLLIAGATGAGKSVFLNVIIEALTAQMSPDDLKLVLVDPKQVELTQFKNLKHLYTPVITDTVEAARMLDKLVQEMEKRYELMSAAGHRSLDEYNADLKVNNKLPKIVAIIDEFADLMMMAENKKETFTINSDELAMNLVDFSQHNYDISRIDLDLLTVKSKDPDVKEKQAQDRYALKMIREMVLASTESGVPSAEHSIIRIAQKARAVGIHLILATQRPSADVVTGLLRSNIPTKVAFMTSSAINSRIILDANGAEELTGKGDMLFQDSSASGLQRLQGLYK